MWYVEKLYIVYALLGGATLRSGLAPEDMALLRLGRGFPGTQEVP